VSANNETLNEKSQEWFERNEDTDDAINSLEIASKDNLRGRFGVDKQGNLVLADKKTGEIRKVAGVTIGPNNRKGSSDVRISKLIFRSNRSLYMTLGHEFHHVDHFYDGRMLRWTNKYGVKKANALSEFIAHSWNASVAHEWGAYSYRDLRWNYALRYYKRSRGK
jgi:hypothetical protein